MKYFTLYEIRYVCDINMSWTFRVFNSFRDALRDWRELSYMFRSISENRYDPDKYKYGKEVYGPFVCEGNEPTQKEIDEALEEMTRVLMSSFPSSRNLPKATL